MPRGLTRLGVAALFACAALTACDSAPRGLAGVVARGELRVATVNEPTSYYLGAHGPQGFEYRLAHAFADSLGVQLVIVPVRDRASMRDMLADGRVDIAAAELTADDYWKRAGLATSSYREIQQLVVQRRGLAPIRNISGLNGTRIVAREGSPQLELLRGLRGSGGSNPCCMRGALLLHTSTATNRTSPISSPTNARWTQRAKPQSTRARRAAISADVTTSAKPTMAGPRNREGTRSDL